MTEFERIAGLAYDEWASTKSEKKRIHPSKEEYSEIFKQVFPWVAAVLKVTENKEKQEEIQKET